MKQKEMHPALFIVTILLVLVVLAALGAQTSGPATPITPAVATAPKPDPAKPDVINGHKVPDGVPYNYMQMTPQVQAPTSLSTQPLPPTHP